MTSNFHTRLPLSTNTVNRDNINLRGDGMDERETILNLTFLTYCNGEIKEISLHLQMCI